MSDLDIELTEMIVYNDLIYSLLCGLYHLDEIIVDWGGMTKYELRWEQIHQRRDKAEMLHEVMGELL